jgi:two-component system response regulator AauR
VTGGSREDRREALRRLGDTVTSVADALLDRGLDLAAAVAAFETRYVRAAIERHDGNLSQAAQALGIHRNTLRAKLKRNGKAALRSD